jgi:hypothetical protein
MTAQNKVILVGRHVSDLPSEIEVISQENILWSLNREEAVSQLRALSDKAQAENAKILLQNVPGVLASAMMWLASFGGGTMPIVGVGVIISVPGPRLAGVSKAFVTEFGPDADVVAQAASFANGRAKTAVVDNSVTVTVDPVSEFKFSHIEWF